jgi:protein-disulfide isomerase
MDRRIQVIVLVVILALAGVVAVVAIPELMQKPQQVAVVNETGETVLQSDYIARYADIPTSRTKDGGFVLGNPDAPVTVVEFADFLCPHCQDYHATARQFIEQYVASGKAKFEYRLFPVVDPELSVFSAQLAECADAQKPGMFWPAYDMLYDLASRGRLSRQGTSQALAETLSLDQNLLLKCTETATQYETDTNVGQGAGVDGTPAVLIRLDENTLGYAAVQGQVYNQGGLSLNVLKQVVEAENITDVVIVPQPIVDNLIHDEPCAAPCWRGITPGETTWEEAAQIVQQSKDLSDIQEQSATDGSSAKVMFWRSMEGIDCCNMLSQDGETVDELLLITSSSTTIGEVIEKRGDPVYAITRATAQGGYVVSLFYPEQQLIVYAFVEGQSAAAFSAESRVIGVSYLSPVRSEQTIEELQPTEWAGYGAMLQYESLATEAPATEEVEAEVQP